MGGIDGANAICAANRPSACGTRTRVAAFLTTKRGQDIRDIPTTYKFDGDLPIYGTNGILSIAPNWTAMVGYDLDTTLYNAGALPSGAIWWSGAVSSNPGMMSAWYSCWNSNVDSWTVGTNQAQGIAGWGETTSAPGRFDINDVYGNPEPTCDSSYYLLCVCGDSLDIKSQ